jgi:tetratricopeptide (TPR) repeat protein
MRSILGLASLLVRAVFVLGVPAVGSAQPPSPQPAPVHVPQPAVTQRPNPAFQRHTLVFDLVTSSGTSPVAVVAPRARDFVIVLKGRVIGASYRVTHDWIIDPDTPGRPPAGALHGEYEMKKMEYRPFPISSFPPACGEIERRFGDLMGARDEREVQEKLHALGDANEGSDCPVLKHRRKEGHDLAEPQLRNSFQLWERDELRYVVEKFDPATGAALKTWRFTVRAEPVGLGWAYENEEAWIVGETSRDIVEMVLYARDRSLPSAEQLAFSVSPEAAPGPFPRYVVGFTPGPGSPQRQALGFASYIWSPESYEPLAAGLINSLKLRPADPSAEGLVSDALTNPLSRVLAQESQRVSQRLQTAMLDAGAHERAALIVGALALREAGGPFVDVRQELCRMSAHLALARALRRGTASPTAAYADALLLTLVQRQKDALARIEALERTRPAPDGAAFLRALRIRITRDWRILPDAAKATLVERLQHYRALWQTLDDEHADAFLASFKAEPIGDWGRITLDTGARAEKGAIFSASLASADMSEAAEVWRILHGSDLPQGKTTEALNVPPQRLVSAEGAARPAPHVIGWGVWARFFQRNLTAAAAASAGFRQSVLGLAKDAQREATVNETFSGLELWPVNSLQEATPLRPLSGRPPTGEREDLRHKECARGVAVVQNAPERVPVYFWLTLDDLCHEARQDQSLPEARRWLRTLTPWGTALMPRQRMVVLMDRTLDGPRLWAALHELAPFERTALWALASDPRLGTFEQVATLYGPLVEYDLAVMKRLAWTRRADVASYRRLFEKVTAVAPLEYLDLGSYLLDVELDDEAAAAFEKAIAQASDRIAVSNSVQWLVGYYCDHARIDRAREVAQMAADVYSARGLQSMGYFSERMGRYADAESWYQKIVERYGEGSGRTALEDFYIRYARRVGDDRFSGQAAAALAKVFPAGLERVSPSDLTSPPPPGQSVTLNDDSQGARGIGIMKDDLVVAVNGYRVRGSRQYHLVLTFDDRPGLTMIVWRQGRYVEVKGRLKRSAYGPIARPS